MKYLMCLYVRRQFISLGFSGTSLDVENFLKGYMCLSIEWKLYTCRNSNREQLREIRQLQVLRQESNLRLCDAGALL